jgi:hypothetical protein
MEMPLDERHFYSRLRPEAGGKTRSGSGHDKREGVAPRPPPPFLKPTPRAASPAEAAGKFADSAAPKSAHCSERFVRLTADNLMACLYPVMIPEMYLIYQEVSQ